ncbi:hypothetical protein ACIBF5_22020 [Micromonospora sp. NPDC050417]|uniref:hypothetical protein n=1 Tax=Micromonospora sp. NPDC050417 TaxID=3364280 RepID=UPI0037B2D777
MSMIGPGADPAPRAPGVTRSYTRRDDLPADVQRDTVALVRVAVREISRRWSRTGGVQELWLILPTGAGSGDDEVLVRRAPRGSLDGYRYRDDIHRAGAFDRDVEGQLPGNRCVALVYGNGWLSPRLPFMSSIDSSALVTVRHQSGVRFKTGLGFRRSGRVLRRIRFDPEVMDWLTAHSPKD